MSSPRLRRRPVTAATLFGLGASTLAMVGVSAPGVISARGVAAVQPDRPNIVMVTADDASVGDLRFMPHTRALLQQQGVTVTEAIAPTPICVPARASLLTGQYADNHGARTISGPRGGFASFRDGNTLPVWLRKAGYRTMFAGKYLNGYGNRRNRNYVPPGWVDWRATTTRTYAFFNTGFNVNGHQQRSRGYSTTAITRHAVGMLQSPKVSGAGARPYFLWVNYVGPHHGGPTTADDPRRRWPDSPSVWLDTTTPAPKDRNLFRGQRIPGAPELWEKNVRGNRFAGPPRRARYRAAMREVFQQRIEALQSVDRGVAALVRQLRANHDLSNTYVLFSSDNGYLTGHHNRDGKLIPYDRSVRIPLVIRGPGVPAGRRLATTITNPDIAVSIAAAAGARPGRAVDGVPVFDRLDGPAAHRPVPLSAWLVRDGRKILYRGIRDGRFTFIKVGNRVELYDRSRDPGELRNVAGAAGYRADRTRLARLYRQYATCRASECPKTWS